MKHLKGFNEELKPHTYRDAAYKLRGYNKDKKSKDLLDWADKQEFGYYNMSFVNSSSVITRNTSATFTNPKLIGMYYGEVKQNNERRPIYGENILISKDSEALANKLVSDWKEGGSELAITFEFGFSATSKTKDIHSYLKNPGAESGRWYISDSVPMFSIELQLSSCNEGIEEWDEDVRYNTPQDEFIPSTLYDFYRDTTSEYFLLQRPNNPYYFGIFSDRTSANKFLKFLKSSINDNVKEKIMDVLTIIGAESEDLERILNSFNRIRVHGLYDSEFTDTTNLERKWFNKGII